MKISSISLCLLASIALVATLRAEDAQPTSTAADPSAEKYRAAADEARAGHYGEALARLDELETINAELPKLWNLRGAIFGELGSYDIAESMFGKAIEKDPKFDDARFNLAELLF